MRSTLVITEPADDLQLLTIMEMRAAAGLVAGDTSQDTILKARGLAVAANIMDECRIAVGSGNDATLLQETVTQTFYGVAVADLMLARRHNVEITSISVDDVTLDDADHFVDPEAGMLSRLSGDCTIRWCGRKIVVVYKAGFEEVPPALKNAAIDYFRAVSSELTRDPYVRSESVEVPGLETRRTELWSGTLPGSAPSNAVPDVVAGQLTRFRNPGGV